MHGLGDPLTASKDTIFGVKMTVVRRIFGIGMFYSTHW